MALPNLYFWHGEESYLLSQRIEEWKSRFIEKHGDLNLSDLDGKESSAEAILSEIQAMPFLGEKRLIFIKNLPPETNEKIDEQKSKLLSEGLEQIPDTSIVVFCQSVPDKRLALYKALSKHATLQEFARLTPVQVKEWLGKECEKRGVKFLPSALHYFVERVGVNLWSIEQELSKLSAYVGEKPISERDIDLLVIPSLEVSIFTLIDRVSERKPKEAIAALEQMMEMGEELMGVLYMLVRQMRFLIQGKELFALGKGREVASLLKIPPFTVSRLEKQASGFSAAELASMHLSLLDIEERLKTGGIRITPNDQTELALALERWMVGKGN